MRPIRTERLRLTPVTVQNAAALWSVIQGPDLRTFQDLPNVGVTAFTSMVAKRPKSLRGGVYGRFEWLIYMNKVRRALGWLSLRIADRENRIGEIGYSVLREFRGKGIATEALRMLIEEAFEEAQLDRISAYCVPANAASRRVLEHLGFHEGGLVHHGASVGGRPVDVLHFTMARKAWRHGTQSKKSIDISASA